MFELIITIVNRGFAEDVMDAAREKGARGGTILHGKGTGNVDKSFFGIKIEPEKELVWIVAKKENAADIMQVIYKRVGLSTSGSGVCFCLPIDDVVGLTPVQI